MPATQDSHVEAIPISEMYLSDQNVRKTQLDFGIQELAQSIRKHGLLQAVIVIERPPRKDGKKYELVVGQRRWLACQQLGRETIDARIYGPMDEMTARTMSLAENLQRAQLNRSDLREAITSLYNEYGRNASRVARELAIGASTVLDYVRIEELATPKIKRKMDKRQLTKEDAQRIIRATGNNRSKADELADKIAGLVSYEKDNLVRYAREHPRSSVATWLKEAQEPRRQETVIVSLLPEVAKALSTAAESIGRSRETIATEALRQWLHHEGFLQEQERMR